MQKINYFYTVEGWLKSINEPNDNDKYDLFFEMLEYYTDDYFSTNGPFLATNDPADDNYYNGNIAKTVWNTRDDIYDTWTSPKAYKYFYNATGQLSEKQMLDGSNDAHFYEYNAYGQLIAVYKDRQKTQKMAEYWYNNSGNRVSKDVYNDMGDVTTTWYIRDINGNILSIYDNNNTTGTFKQSEVPIYGNNRLGVRYLAADGSNEKTLFEISDHLGNVRATFSRNLVNGEPALQSKADYYPFGMKQPGASLISSYNYRFGYQGEFAEDETQETGYNSFELRLYDSKIGRRTTTDPYGQYWSPYMAMNNNPINFVDPDGGFDTKFGAWVYSVFNGGNVGYGYDKGKWFVGKQVEYTGEGAGIAYQRTFESNSSTFSL